VQKGHAEHLAPLEFFLDGRDDAQKLGVRFQQFLEVDVLEAKEGLPLLGGRFGVPEQGPEHFF